MNNNHCPMCGEETIGGATCITCRVEDAQASEDGPDLYDLLTEYPSDPPPDAG